MAKQEGIIRFTGTMGGITFTKNEDGYIARQKTTLDGNRIATDPNYARTRENNSEFGGAANAAKLMRDAAKDVVLSAKDSRLSNRLTKYMLKAAKLDTTSARGMRNVTDGDLTVLQGFDFNANAPITSIFSAQYTGTINRVAGTMAVNIPAFTPINGIVAPEGTTHFNIVSAGLELNFVGGTSVTGESASGELPWDGTATSAIVLSNSVTAASTNALFLLLGVQFFQQVNGIYYSLKNGSYNPLAIVSLSVE